MYIKEFHENQETCSTGISGKLSDLQYRYFTKIRFSRCPVKLRGKKENK
jgi:hypothetical protein